jgi:hypothetical protein
MEPLVRAATELRCFGWSWCVAGLVVIAGGALAGSLSELRGLTIALALNVLGLSVACMLAALVLGKRTGPRMLYARIFDRSPAAPPGVPIETPRQTAVRVIAPAAALAVVLLVVAPVVMGAALTFVGIPRDELPDELPAALIVSAGWLLAASAVALQVAHYFEHWERWRGRTVLCPPLRAGLMRYVYLAAPGAEGR